MWERRSQIESTTPPYQKQGGDVQREPTAPAALFLQHAHDNFPNASWQRLEIQFSCGFDPFFRPREVKLGIVGEIKIGPLLLTDPLPFHFEGTKPLSPASFSLSSFHFLLSRPHDTSWIVCGHQFSFKKREFVRRSSLFLQSAPPIFHFQSLSHQKNECSPTHPSTFFSFYYLNRKFNW